MLASLFFIVLFFVAGQKAVLATASPTGITVSPAFQQVTVATGETTHPVTFKITNDKNVPQTLSLTAADFNTLNESGGLFFVGTNPTDLQNKYGLAKWFNIPQNVITLEPKQTRIVTANIINLPDMVGGGHYGALMIRIADSGIEKVNNNKVAIDPIASSLLFVTKVGGDTHNLSLTDVSYTHSHVKLPKLVDLRFTNTGNSHVVPRGIVKIVSPNGQLFSQGTINENSNIILPGSRRVYSVPLQQHSRNVSPGRYKLYVDFRFDGIDQPRGYQTSFWIILIKWLVIPIVGLSVLVGLGIYSWRRRRLPKQS